MSTPDASPAAPLTSPKDLRRRAGDSSFRPDIEGLRAVAIGVVLLYHAGLRFVPGGFIGVDVFFVISGFLITGVLLRELRREGRISLSRFYARRVRRLLPAATLVLLTTSLLVLTLGSPSQRRTFAGDIAASALSVVNWRFAGRSVDYQAEGIGASPVQHFWSLAVEEQFYVVWPLIMVVAGIAALRFRWNAPRLAVGALWAVLVTSLCWSVIATLDEPARAFFVTTTRLWELGIGAMLAAAVPMLRRLQRLPAMALGWVGLATVGGAALVFDDSLVWPGAVALVPTLGTAAVIAAGSSDPAWAPLVLRWKWVVWIGGLSYSLYLWHWPLLIAAEWQWGALGPRVGLVIVLCAFVPAWLSYRLVENPVRRSTSLAASSRLALSLGAALAASSVVVALVVGSVRPATSSSLVVAGADELGARSLHVDGVAVSGIDSDLRSSAYTPAAEDARDDLPAAYADGCNLDQRTAELRGCVYGDPSGDTRIVLTGDSKAAQWSDALAVVSERQGIALDVATKSACPFAHAPVLDGQGEPYDSCLEYGDALEADMLADPPDVVVVSQGAPRALDQRGEWSMDVMVDALAQRWSRLEAAGVDVVVLMDNPSPVDLPAGDGQVPDCLLEYPEDFAACAFDREEGMSRSSEPTLRAALQRVPVADSLEMADALCDEDSCPPVIGETLVYRQGTHVTNTYAVSAAGILESRLLAILDL